MAFVNAYRINVQMFYICMQISLRTIEESRKFVVVLDYIV